jgi:uncharacterized Zn finger protein
MIDEDSIYSQCPNCAKTLEEIHEPYGSYGKIHESLEKVHCLNCKSVFTKEYIKGYWEGYQRQQQIIDQMEDAFKKSANEFIAKCDREIRKAIEG